MLGRLASYPYWRRCSVGILFGSSGCLLVKGGITKLSELEIDTDKDWNSKGIFNLKELDAGMGKGDIVYHNGTRLAKLSPGTIGDELTSRDPFGIGWEAPPGD